GSPRIWRLSVSLSQLSNTLPQFPCCSCCGVNSIQIASVPLTGFPLPAICPTSVSLQKTFFPERSV
ncbi:BgTH12-06787, partial [Blumeria graminis f. sp. triticale]